MIVKLEALYSNNVDEILINNNFEIPYEYYKNSEVINLKNLHLNGKIFKNSSNELILNGILTGVMVIEDSISLDEIDYDFSINIEEILENDENTIDIIPILWQNIVLEVPLRFTKVKDYNSYSGDGWKLVNEEEEKNNNPFLEFSKNFKEE